MKKIFLLVAVLLITGCSTDTEERDCCTNIDTGVSIKYLNEEGENLFEMDGGLNLTDITIYHKMDNKWIKYYKGNLDSPKGIKTIEREDGTYLVIFPGTSIVENNYSETKIEFSESDFDVLKTEIDKNNSNKVVTKVWYNDELKWEGNQTERIIEVIR